MARDSNGVQFSNTNYSITDTYSGDGFNYLRFHEGCNAFIIGLKTDFKVYVVKDVADKFLKTCDISLDRYMEEAKMFGVGFEFEGEDTLKNISYPNEPDIPMSFISSAHKIPVTKDTIYYIFKVRNDPELTKKHYYTFCFIRKLYYQGNNYINYFLNVKPEHTFVEKIYLLGSQGNDIFNSNSIIREDYLSLMVLNNNNGSFTKWYIAPHNTFKDKILIHEAAHDRLKFVNFKTDKSIKPCANQYYLSDRTDLKETGSFVYEFGSKYKIYEKQNMKIRILSRHPSHKPLRDIILNKKVLYRLGSTTAVDGKWFEINKISAIENSSNKRLMKICFSDHKISTPKWAEDNTKVKNLKYPIVAKHIKGSRGTGNYKLENNEEFNKFCKNKRNISSFIFEEFCNYKYEYRVHVSRFGVFLIWQKLRKKETPSDKRWIYNNDNCVFIGEKNPIFKQIDVIKLNKLAVDTLNSVQLDIGSIDVKVNEKGDMKVIEINSAPSLAEQGIQSYKNEILKLCAE